MKIVIRREMSFAQLRQCLFEQLFQIEDRFRVKHSRNITLYMTPTNGSGDEVYCRDERGVDITALYSDGPYKCADEGYEI